MARAKGRQTVKRKHAATINGPEDNEQPARAPVVTTNKDNQETQTFLNIFFHYIEHAKGLNQPANNQALLIRDFQAQLPRARTPRSILAFQQYCAKRFIEKMVISTNGTIKLKQPRLQLKYFLVDEHGLIKEEVGILSLRDMLSDDFVPDIHLRVTCQQLDAAMPFVSISYKLVGSKGARYTMEPPKPLLTSMETVDLTADGFTRDVQSYIIHDIERTTPFTIKFEASVLNLTFFWSDEKKEKKEEFTLKDELKKLDQADGDHGRIPRKQHMIVEARLQKSVKVGDEEL
ncbi:hypothetical protein OHC33_005580 [Knufia fluminis]|uniref:Uncharacterized protein n=1 Tax=Knufia fluminis TaxID=191047 RepID=A0AAN8F935_9EURO|nr:hypothetical protein OHC33_005580 [Knufia fluminis]